MLFLGDTRLLILNSGVLHYLKMNKNLKYNSVTLHVHNEGERKLFHNFRIDAINDFCGFWFLIVTVSWTSYLGLYIWKREKEEQMKFIRISVYFLLWIAVMITRSRLKQMLVYMIPFSYICSNVINFLLYASWLKSLDD